MVIGDNAMICHGHSKLRGFSLIELVVVMLIAAILISIAIPGYSSYVRKARRTEAKTALLDLASLEERYFSTQNSYTNVNANLGYPGTGTTWPVTIGSGYYTVTVPTPAAGTATTPASYSASASPLSGSDQTKDSQCGTFTITSTGVQSSKDSTGTVDTTATCWR